MLVGVGGLCLDCPTYRVWPSAECVYAGAGVLELVVLVLGLGVSGLGVIAALTSFFICLPLASSR